MEWNRLFSHLEITNAASLVFVFLFHQQPIDFLILDN